MANFTALKTAIQNAIKQNGNEEITGDVLQQILLSIVSTMGDGVINTIEQNLTSETTNRQSADTQLQNAINAIKANIDNGYVYAGIATPSANPVSGKVFYIATAAGTYTNFGGQVLTRGVNILRYNGSAWSSQQLIGIDDAPTAGSNSLVKSGGVQNELALGAVYDVSAKNPTAGPNNDGKFTLEYILDQNNVNTLIPTAYRKGGMSIKFVHSSDNKYVQYRLMSDTFSTTVSNWQGVDDEPTAGSENVVKSGGVEKVFRNLDINFKDYAKIVNVLKKDGIDFEINDGNYAIVQFKNGHIRTKYFNSEDKVIPQIISYVKENVDFEISDGNYAIVQFKDGHIKTKYFDSRTQTNENAEKTLFNYVFKTHIDTDFDNNNNWIVSDGALKSINPGLQNKLTNSRGFTIGEKYTYCRFTAYSDSNFAIGWVSSAYSSDSSLFSINCGSNIIALHEAWVDKSVVPNIKYQEPYNFVNGREYEIVIEKEEHINKIYVRDCLTGDLSNKIESEQTATSGLNEFSGGRQMDKICIVHIGGTSPDIKYLKSVSKIITPLIICYGDSITEGDRVYNGQTYVDLLKEKFGRDRVICSGLSGSTISNVIERIKNEMETIRPKYVMVTIGTNGGNSQALFNELKELITNCGAVPVINVPPMFSGIDVIRNFVLNLNVQTVRFDIATAVNYNPQEGQNSALFADGIHPNAQGHKAMYERILSDINDFMNF